MVTRGLNIEYTDETETLRQPNPAPICVVNFLTRGIK